MKLQIINGPNLNLLGTQKTTNFKTDSRHSFLLIKENILYLIYSSIGYKPEKLVY